MLLRLVVARHCTEYQPEVHARTVLTEDLLCIETTFLCVPLLLDSVAFTHHSPSFHFFEEETVRSFANVPILVSTLREKV